MATYESGGNKGNRTPGNRTSPAENVTAVDSKVELLSDSEGSKGGTDGAAGKIAFRYKDAASLGPRDDMLPAHLAAVHRDVHKDRVDKQKFTRKEREAFKEGKAYHQGASHQAGKGHSYGNQYKQHPILSNKSQFSGMDSQVTANPKDFDAETNLEMREKLENRFVNRFTPQYTPTPRPRGS